MTMNFAILFFISSVIACACFSLGRVVGKWDEQHDQKNKSRKLKNIEIDLSNFDFEKPYENHPDPDVIDAEFEDVVYDLQAYKDKKDRERSIEIDNLSNYEIMFSKRDGQFVKVPKEVADLIRHIKERYDST